MEHLVLAHGGNLQRLDEVPYVASDDYRGIPFFDYLAVSNKWSLFENPQEGTLEQQACLWQTWFCFCLLQDFLGPLFSHDDYVDTRDNDDGTQRLVFTTAKLPEILGLWVQGVTQTPPPDSFRHHSEVLRLIKGNVQFRQELRVFAISAQAVTAELLDKLAFVRGDNSNVVFPNALRYFHDDDLEIMRAQGWCAYEASRHWSDSCSIQAQMMLRTSHRNTVARHDECTRQRCAHIQIEPKTFRVSHCANTCECEMFSIDLELVGSILRSGSFPVLSTKGTLDGHFESIDVVPSANCSPYVAISHVWADGLGNPHSNSLPQCRMRELIDKIILALRRHAGHIDGDKIFFWLDTLCCPIGPPDMKTAALLRMKETYRLASYTLVLDAHLQSIELSSVSMLEAGLQIVNSRWMLRLWYVKFAMSSLLPFSHFFLLFDDHSLYPTIIGLSQSDRPLTCCERTLQEAGLAQRLFFRLKDSEVEASTLQKWLAIASPQLDHSKNVVIDVRRKLQRLQAFFTPENLNRARPFLRELVETVQTRGLSVPLDEPLCLTTVLGGNTELLRGDRAERMAFFWSVCASQGYLRPSFIFNTLPKLCMRGYGWAPESLLFDSHHIPTYDRRYIMGHESMPSCSLSQEGLVLRAPGCMMGTASDQDGPAFFDSIDWYPHRRMMAKTLTTGQWSSLTFFHPQDGRPGRTRYGTGETIGLGMIVDLYEDPVSKVCAVVEVVERRSDTIRVSLLARSHIHKHSADESTEIQILADGDQEAIVARDEDGQMVIPSFLRPHALRANHDVVYVEQYLRGLAAQLRQGQYFVIEEDLPGEQCWTVE